MQPTIVYNCLKLCLLVIFCTATPVEDSDLSSGEVAKARLKLKAPQGDSDLSSGDDGKVRKLKAPQGDSDLSSGDDGKVKKLQAPQGDSDLSSGDDGKVKKLQAPAGDSDLSSGDDGKIVKLDANNKGAEEVLSDNAGANDVPVDDDEKDDAAVADDESQKREDDEVHDNSQGVSDAKKEAVPSQDNSLEKGASAADEKADSKIKDEQVQENSQHAPNQDLSDVEKSNSEEEEESLPSENKSGDVVQNENSASSINKIKHAIQIIYKDCALGNNDCKYDINVLSSLPGFSLTPEEIIKFKIWPSAKIPYYIDDLSYDKVLRDKIRSYLDDARPLTGLNFEELADPPDNDNDRWVFFVNRRGQLDCKDYNTNSFTNTGVQKVIIGYNCLEHGGPMAAIVLALVGVAPQHNAPDRDRYITVVTDNILPEKRGLFRPVKDSEWLFHDLGYDFNSISHYPSHKYTADGSETIKILKEKELKQQRSPLLRGPVRQPSQDISSINNEKRTYSGMDLLKIRYLYNHLDRDSNWDQRYQKCSTLYKAGPKFRDLKMKNSKKVLSRPKPKQYLDAVQNEGGNEVELAKRIEGADLSSLGD